MCINPFYRVTSLVLLSLVTFKIQQEEKGLTTCIMQAVSPS